MQFMNFNLDASVKNLLEMDFTYSQQEFSGKLLKQVKQKRVYPYEHLDSFKKLSEDKLLDRGKCFSSFKSKCIGEEDYLHANNAWNG